MKALSQRRTRFSYGLKMALAAGLVLLADRLFLFHEPGWTLGAFAAAWLTATLIARRDVFRDRRAIIAAALGYLFAFSLVEQPFLIGLALFLIAIAFVALLPRTGPFGNAAEWFVRLIWLGLLGFIAPVLDARRASKATAGARRPRIAAILAIIAVPVIGAAIFISLFAVANPVIAGFLARIRWPRFDAETLGRIVLWGFFLCVVWSTLRPRRLRLRFEPMPQAPAGPTPLPLQATSIAISLVVFNVIFAVQNGLDIAFLWSGAALPEGMTVTEYVHRGAYPLIVTALLAAAFVLIFLRPGSETARNPLIRWLVVIWVIQNGFLVASSIERTLDYIRDFNLTGLRIAALLWMGLVGLGLALICWRLLANKPAAWLINTNVAAALFVLSACCFVDINAIAADWNVRHAREAGGAGAPLDLKYLKRLGPSALGASAWFSRQPGFDPSVRADVEAIWVETAGRLQARQSEWSAWTWRDHRRLARWSPPAAPAPQPQLTNPSER